MREGFTFILITRLSSLLTLTVPRSHTVSLMSIYCPIEVFIPAFGEKLYSMSIGYSNSSGGQSFGLKGESGCECPTQRMSVGRPGPHSVPCALLGGSPSLSPPNGTWRGGLGPWHQTLAGPHHCADRGLACSPAAPLLPRASAADVGGRLGFWRSLPASPSLGSGDSSTLRPLFALWPHPPAPSLVQVRAVTHS